MPRINLLQLGVKGVDMKSNPLVLGGKKLCAAVNMRFEEGVVRTRPGFRYVETGTIGQFQGACFYQPKFGISSSSFNSSDDALVIAVAGKLWSDGEEITGELFKNKGDVQLFQAENYLIVQNLQTDTFWWNGTSITRSPGMNEVTWEDIEPPLYQKDES